LRHPGRLNQRITNYWSEFESRKLIIEVNLNQEN
jgi:hypothetical protein